jgi:hypothetical protein
MSNMKICHKCKYERKATDDNPEWQCPACGVAYGKIPSHKKSLKRYFQNTVPLQARLLYIVSSLGLIINGIIGIVENDLVLPRGKRMPYIHFHDEPAIFVFGACMCAAVIMISVVFDHYDERDNESEYLKFQVIVGSLGAILFSIGILWVG